MVEKALDLTLDADILEVLLGRKPKLHEPEELPVPASIFNEAVEKLELLDGVLDPRLPHYPVEDCPCPACSCTRPEFWAGQVNTSVVETISTRCGLDVAQIHVVKGVPHMNPTAAGETAMGSDGSTIISVHPNLSPEQANITGLHELTHVVQISEFKGDWLAFHEAYLAEEKAYGYARNKYELEAIAMSHDLAESGVLFLR
jgi:hypothetical protein